MNPDLNSIENLWGIIGRRIYGQEKPSLESIVELRKRIKSTWTNIQNETLNKLVDSIPDRLIKVIENKGRSVEHLIFFRS